MNYIQHLNTFLWLLQRERRLTPSHISLYLALFHYWNCNRFENPFPLYRERLMQMSAIGSKSTYFKCLKELHQLGYIVYNPSLHKNHRPKVSLMRWRTDADIHRQMSLFNRNIAEQINRDQADRPRIDPLTVPDMDHLMVRIGTLTEPDPGNSPDKAVPLTGSDLGIDIKQDINRENIEREARARASSSDQYQQGNPNTGTPRGAATTPPANISPPEHAEVLSYFKEMNYPPTEAARFFSHYRANGWKQAGKVAIQDWKAAADKWITYYNEHKTKNISYGKSGINQLPAHLNLQQHKNYDDPL